MCSISASLFDPTSHLHMITVLANLNTGCDNSSLDKPCSLKEVMRSPYWKDFEKAIHSEFQSLIENDTWEYQKAPSDRVVLTSC